MATADIAYLDREVTVQYSESLTTKALRRLRQDKMTIIAMVIIVVLFIVSLFAPFFSEYVLGFDPDKTDPRNNFLPPLTDGHILGTDDIGRDQLARLLHAGSVSLRIGLFGGLLSITLGMSIGILTGYSGGFIDDMVNWVITTVDALPALYLLILFSTFLEPSAESLILAITLIGWTGTTRLIRGQTLTLRENDYVLAARALGASRFRIMSQHIFPNLISITVVSLAINIANLILVESALSFLGLGVQPPQATWGNMLTKSLQFFRQGAHLVIPPGFLIFITVLCFYVIGDGIRDAFDPTLNNRD